MEVIVKGVTCAFSKGISCYFTTRCEPPFLVNRIFLCNNYHGGIVCLLTFDVVDICMR